jgi:hypothetical protein
VQAAATLGPVDAVFCGYRGWKLYPAHFIFSSVAQYLFLAPPEAWRVRQHIMTAVDEAIDVAERWGARYLLPYGDGGAPWFWRIGLGPDLLDPSAEIDAFDPFPERVVDAAAHRSIAADRAVVETAVNVVVLRPGDSLRDLAGNATLHRVERHAWPW